MAEHLLITGGSRGLGLALCEATLRHGYTVTSVSRRRSAALSRLIEEFPDHLTTVFDDLETLDPHSLIRSAEERAPIYGLVNNAAVAEDGLLVATSPTVIARTVQVNLTATMLLSRAVAKRMIRRRRGRILTISSILSRRAAPGLAAYSSTKAAVEQFTRVLAREIGPRSITVNCVAPGFLDTEMTESLDPSQRERLHRHSALSEPLEARDVCGAVLFLLSDAARMITGTTLVVDGGLSL